MNIDFIKYYTIRFFFVLVIGIILAGCNWGSNVNDMGDVSLAESLWNSPDKGGSDSGKTDITRQASASYGVYEDRIGLKWSLEDSDIKYEIYRADSSDGVFTLLIEINKEDVITEITYPATIKQQAEFISDVNLTDGVKFPITYDDYGTPAIDFIVGNLSFTVAFPPVTTWDLAAGEWLVGHKYTRSEVIAKINTAAGIIICKPEGTQYLSITAPKGSILISNGKNISYISTSIVSTFLKSGVSKTGTVTVDPKEIPNPDYVNNNGKPVAVDYYYYDNKVTQGNHYFYKIASVNADGVETRMNNDTGIEGLAAVPGPITDQEFLRMFKKQHDYAILKFTHFGTNGSDNTTGNISGTGAYTAGIGITGGSIKEKYDNYSDYGLMIFNGSKNTTITSVNAAKMTGSGTTAGTVAITGKYSGYVKFDFIVTDNNEAGGYYYVKQDGAASETRFPYDFK